MRRHAIWMTALTASTALVVLAAPAGAAPWHQQWLPDADLFCGEELDHEVEAWVGNPRAGTLFVDDDTYGGHYVTVAAQHYLADGVQLDAAVTDVGTLIPLDEGRSLGEKEGLDTIECQVVSRWSFGTVVAPIVLAPVS